MLNVIKGRRQHLEQQMIDSIFQGDTKNLNHLHERLASRADLTLIEPIQTQAEPESLHQSDEAPV